MMHRWLPKITVNTSMVLFLIAVYSSVLRSFCTNTFAEGFEILETCQNTQVGYNCSDSGSMTVWSDVVSFSCFISRTGKIQKKCNNTYKVRKISVLALDAVKIDEDVMATGEELEVTVIAPTWEVVGARKIVLDGFKGQDYPERARDAFSSGDGENGRPGKRGGPGGRFFGVGEKFINGRNLFISSNGGDGGSGQDGGDGKNGTQGSSASNDTRLLLSLSCKDRICNNNRVMLKNLLGKREIFECTFLKEYSPSLNFTDFPATVTGLKKVEEYLVKGKKARAAGKGGNGGMKGKPGHSGVIVLININEANVSSEILTENREGKTGERDGRGGKGGTGSVDGQAVSVKRCCLVIHNNFVTVIEELPFWVDLKYRPSHTSVTNGENGSDGVTPDLVNSTRPSFNQTGILMTINEYKIFIRSRLTDTRRTFLRMFEESDKITGLYDSYQYFLELVSLENSNDTAPYRTLLYAMRGLTERNEHVRNSTQEMKVLGYLCAAFASRINSLNIVYSNNLVFEINDFLGRFKYSVVSLLNEGKRMEQLWIVKDYIKKVLNNVNNKIVEGKYFITKELTAQVNIDGKKINKELIKVLDIESVLHKHQIRNHKKLSDKNDNLQDYLVLRVVWGIINLISKILSFLVLFLETANVIVQRNNNLQSLSIREEEVPAVIPEIEELILVYVDELQSLTEKDITRFTWVLDEMTKVTTVDSRRFLQVINTINHIRQKMSHGETFMDVQKLRIELSLELLKNYNERDLLKFNELSSLTDEKEINNKFGEGLGLEGKPNSTFTSRDENWRKIIQLANLPSSLEDFLLKLRTDAEKDLILYKAIYQLEGHLDKLKYYEDGILATLITMLERTKSDLEFIEEKFARKSTVYFDLRQWKVETILNSTKLNMRRITKKLKNKEKLQNSLSGITAALTVLREIYERLQDYDMTNIWQHCIADVSSTEGFSASVTNLEISNATTYTEKVIRYDLVLQQYNAAVTSYRHYVFPFASVYLEGFEAPRRKKDEEHIDDYVAEIEKQVSTIEKKFFQFRTSKTDLNRYKGEGFFLSLYFPASKPFFVWTNQDHKNMISTLLSGKPVIANAEVLKSGIEYYAIKFKYIVLNLKTANKSKQSELNGVLRGFYINATHLGYSQYRYGDKVYTITTESLSIWHSFLLDEQDKPVKQGGAYRKLENSNYLLSPYSLWKFQILNNSFNNSTFSDLTIFRDEVDVELGGYGFYLLTKILEKDIKIDEFYSATDI